MSLLAHLFRLIMGLANFELALKWPNFIVKQFANLNFSSRSDYYEEIGD